MKNKAFSPCRLFLLLGLATLFSRLAEAATTNVTFGNDFFSPSTVTINVGDTVVFSNSGGTHTVTGTGADPFCGSGVIPASCSHTFNVAGSFPYECLTPGHAQAGMVGTVIVKAAANAPPSVGLTSPASGATFAAPANILVQATASDSDGTVATVQLLTNGIPYATPVPPGGSSFGIVLSGLDTGSYAVRATAKDNGGLSATSSVVNVSVVAAVPVVISGGVQTNGQFRFNYSANAGLSYVVQSALILTNSPVWTSLRTNIASGALEQFSEASGASPKFYRIVRLPNP